MVDLIVAADSVVQIDAANPAAPKYGLLRMGANSTIRCLVDVTIKAERAEFAENCLIDATGDAGAAGLDPPPPGPVDPMGNQRATAGHAGGGGGAGRNVVIEAGLARIGTLTIVASGGPGGTGGTGQAGFDSGRGEGGRGGRGGAGGKGGRISILWTRLAAGLPAEPNVMPPGHAYIAAGGAGGAGAPGGLPGRPQFPGGAQGDQGVTGTEGTVEIGWASGPTGLWWVQRQNMGPAGRAGHEVAFDTGRGRLVLFGGGADKSAFGDTWEWDGQLWCQVADTGPSARRDHAMAYDSARQRVLLFGGREDDGTLMADTWAWDGSWVQLADTGPSARAGHAMADDPGRGRVALFGGDTVSTSGVVGPAGDTWEWDGTNWTQIEDTGPTARSGAKLAYDPASGTILLFGGAADPGTWAWDGTKWTQVADMGPAPRSGHALASAKGAIILFGGRLPGGGPRGPGAPGNDTWAWFAQAWRQIQDIGPAPRQGHAMALDPGGGVVAFGGESEGAFRADTWQLSERT